MWCLMRQYLNKLNIISNVNPEWRVANLVCSSALDIRPKFYSNAPTPHEIVDTSKDKLITEDVIKKINEKIKDATQGRLFAIVHVAGKQFKITEGDLIVIEGYWPPTAGDKISLNKILMLGAADFTLIGRPVIQNGLANVQATVIEKTLSHTKTHFRKKRRKQYMRIHFYRIQQTMLRINKVELVGELNNPPEITGLEYVIL